MPEMCQSQQFYTWDANFCHMGDQSTFCWRYHGSLSHGIQGSVTPAQTFAGKKIKTQRSSFESSMKWRFTDIFPFRANKNV